MRSVSSASSFRETAASSEDGGDSARSMLRRDSNSTWYPATPSSRVRNGWMACCSLPCKTSVKDSEKAARARLSVPPTRLTNTFDASSGIPSPKVLVSGTEDGVERRCASHAEDRSMLFVSLFCDAEVNGISDSATTTSGLHAWILVFQEAVVTYVVGECERELRTILEVEDKTHLANTSYTVCTNEIFAIRWYLSSI